MPTAKKNQAAEPETTRTHSVRVRIREVPYSVLTFDILGNAQIEMRSGYGPGRPEIEPNRRTDVDEETAAEDYALGQKIELMDADYVRLLGANCVVDADKVQTIGEEDGVELLDVRTASVDDLARWIKEENPRANDVVQASNGEAELAQKLLEAEVQANEGEARKSVLDGLGTVISRG